MTLAKLKPPPGPAQMSVRECRLILERLLVVAGVDGGAVPSVRDLLVDAELLGAGVLRLLNDDPAVLTPDPDAALPVVRTDDDTLVVDAGGTLAAFVAPLVRDLVLEHGDGVTIRVVGVRHPQLLSGVAAALARRGLAVVVHTGPEPDAALVAGAGGVMKRALGQGLSVESPLWLELYLRSNRALVPDSLTLKRHYGAVDDDGNLADPAFDDLEVDQALAAYLEEEETP